VLGADPSSVSARENEHLVWISTPDDGRVLPVRVLPGPVSPGPVSPGNPSPSPSNPWYTSHLDVSHLVVSNHVQLSHLVWVRTPDDSRVSAPRHDGVVVIGQ